MISSFLANYFGFNRQQRNGLLVLMAISFLLLVVRIAYPYFIQPDADIRVENLPLIEQKLGDAEEARQPVSNGYGNKAGNAALFVFNPNTVSYEQLLLLGFREKTAKTFLKFRSKGFVFKEKQDLKKIYGIGDAFYTKLEPYILPEPVAEQKHTVAEPVEQETNNSTRAANSPPPYTPEKKAAPAQAVLELNSCDSAALTALSGIGPSYARRIIKYRSLLGGYVNTVQLKEVFGFPEELYEKIKPFVKVNAVELKQLNLNTDDFKTINRHPYLSYELTKVIFDWRKKTAITALNLKGILNDDALYLKLLPYLAFN